MPQLASGEIAWAVDTQELYIGNGSVFEGSPGVGNTKILTQNDLTIQGNLLNLLQHIYKVNDSDIQTGPTANAPVNRSVQDRLDDRVTAFDFGAVADGDTDDTVALQRAIDQLFFNSSAEAFQSNANGVANRVVLELPAGKYIITDTLVIPSYATIVGAGSDKTILQFENTGTAIEYRYDNFEDPNPETNTQTRFVTLKGVTISVTAVNQIGMDMYAVRDSQFEDVIIQGVQASDNANSIGIRLNSPLLTVTCERNLFKNVTITGFTYGVYSVKDILNNTFVHGYIHNVTQGISLGFGLTGGSGEQVGEQYGPRKTTIDNVNFENIKQHAVYIGLGTDNTVKNSRLTEVGQDGGSITFTQYPQIYFKTPGNSSENNSSDRWEYLHNETYRTTAYIPEVSGWGTAAFYASKNINLGSNSGSPLLAFRLPTVTDSGGAPNGSVVYVIDYVFQSTSSSFTRRGTMTISADLNNVYGQLSDDYDYSGPVDLSVTAPTLLDFSLEFRDVDGDPIVMGTSGANTYSIVVNYVNPSDAGRLTYTYKTAFTNQNS